ncbi:hypothetical protein SUGI_0208620 [Cryptomeria japonica]|uniref:uncharacterized protein LOC131027905 n=1 Tax=Cryptomeria japonica TaxID=3369 RepID=UPI002408B26D|nr:uncharacterized protein LOC131027905 [Cryptomeria japonica]GLJ13245.1 hypothetical protein SUGI_0208620 [Cryptomeria japonica]
MACTELLESPRISFSRDFSDLDLVVERRKKVDNKESMADEDFEFCMGLSEGSKPTMLPAEVLFSEGKILPFQFSQSGNGKAMLPTGVTGIYITNEKANKLENSCEGSSIKSNGIACEHSPKAPKCSWKEILGLKKLQTQKSVPPKTTPKTPKKPNFTYRIRCINSGVTTEASSVSQPLLLQPRDSDADSASARFSVSSNQSDLEELPRYSVDSIKEDAVLHKPLRAVNVIRPAEKKGSKCNSPRTRGASSGKVVFKGLERSCSSPSSFRKRESQYRIERSYSANVRVTPVLNVNVPSCIRNGKGASKGGGGGGGGMFGLTNLFSSPQKKDSNKHIKNPSQSHLASTKIKPTEV